MQLDQYYIAIDIGGTEIKYGILDASAAIFCKSKIETEAWKGGPAILQNLIRIVGEILAEGNGTCAGICISTAGVVDVKRGSIISAAPLIPNYAGTKLKETLENEFHIRCEAENDVNCAGLAEAYSGAAYGYESAVMLTVGTGIGGCILFNGAVYHGSRNYAGEIGYLWLGDEDFQNQGAASVLCKKVAMQKGNTEVWNGVRIFEAAKAGDKICINAIDEMTDCLGKGIANLCYVLNPEVVVLGGGIMAQQEYLEKRLNSALDRYLISDMRTHTQLAFAKHQNDAGMIGAFYHFKNASFR